MADETKKEDECRTLVGHAILASHAANGVWERVTELADAAEDSPPVLTLGVHEEELRKSAEFAGQKLKRLHREAKEQIRLAVHWSRAKPTVPAELMSELRGVQQEVNAGEFENARSDAEDLNTGYDKHLIETILKCGDDSLGWYKKRERAMRESGVRFRGK